MDKIDLRKQFKHLYTAPADRPVVVDVPRMTYLMLDGEGDPSAGPAFGQAVEALYSLSYALKFLIKRGRDGVDFTVMPLEGLWWAEDMQDFRAGRRDRWKWTVMIHQPKYVTRPLFQALVQTMKVKKPMERLDDVRLAALDEGPCAQILHIGPFAEEAKTVALLHQFIHEEGHTPNGKHHEIYLSDPRRVAPAKMKTLLRQPFE